MNRPLSNLERGIWVVDSATGMNGSAIAHLDGAVTPEDLRRALDLLQRRHPLLGVHVEERDFPWFVSEGTEGLALQIEPRRDDDQWHDALYEEINHKFVAGPRPLMRARALLSPERADLILTFHHAISDGRGIIATCGEFLDLLARPRGSSEAAIERLPEHPPADAHLFPLLWSGRGLRAAFISVMRAIWTFFFRRPIKLPEDTPALFEHRRSRTMHRPLPPELAREVARRARHEETTVHGALCSALLLSMAAHMRERAGLTRAMTLGCLSPVDLRPMFAGTLIEGLGCYANAAMVSQRVGPGTDFWDLARAQQSDIYARRASGEISSFSALQSIVSSARVNPRLAARGVAHAFWGGGAVTNLGVLKLCERYGGLRLRNFHAAAAATAYGNFISMAATTYGGATVLNMTYTEPLLSPVTANSLADGVLACLGAAVVPPSNGIASA